MSSTQWLLLGLLVIGGFWMVGAHNRVVGLRAAIVEAWSQVDGLLERRGQVIETLAQALWDLWPNGRGVVDALRSAQQQLHTAAVAVRGRPTRADAAASLATAEGALNATVARVLNQVESDAELHANDAVATQMLALFEFGPQLIDKRQRFNGACVAYNDAIRQFPTSLLAPVFRFETAGSL
ncbi:MAG TPA: LemA family protein [Burkholderiaceae bacterium]|nr:LemA family protein [Burkholderiaceae bacterium]